MRYFIHHLLRSGDIIHDLKGLELRSLAVAEKEAARLARDLMASAARTGHDFGGQAMQITDTGGTVLATISFASLATESG